MLAERDQGPNSQRCETQRAYLLIVNAEVEPAVRELIVGDYVKWLHRTFAALEKR